MKKNIISELNDEVLLFTKNIKQDISANQKFTYLIVARKPFFRIDKLKTFLIENQTNDFAQKQLTILLENCNIFLSLDKEYDAIKTNNIPFNIHFTDEDNGKEIKITGNNKKLFWFTGKSLMKMNEDEFLKTYRNKKMFIYSHSFFSLSINEIKNLKILIFEFINKEKILTEDFQNFDTSTQKNIVTDFAELYCYNLDKYLIESKNIIDNSDKLNYWQTKIYEYKRDHLNLGLRDKFEILGINVKVNGIDPLNDNSFKKFCSKQIRLLENEIEYQTLIYKEPQQTKTKKSDEIKKTLNDYFVNIKDDKKEDFFNELKKMFPTEKGKSIKVIIDSLKSENLLSIGTREFSKFLIVLAEMFGRDIGKYQGIQNVNFNDIDKETKEPIEIKLNPLINKYKTK